MPFSGIRAPAVAGSFYSSDPETLRSEVEEYLEEGRRRVGRGHATRAVVAPHAGYVYSGAIAGSAFARLVEVSAGLERVVLLGPSHRVRLRGLALPAAGTWETPLGELRVDRDAARSLLELPQVSVHGGAHLLEHSLEVQLPFLQSLEGDFRILPLVVGWAPPEEVAEVLELVWDEGTAVVVSSDLSHYLDYESARSRDRATAAKIVGLDPSLGPEEACGAGPLNGLLLAVARRGLEVETLDLRNSGDTAGDRARVVGYGAFGFHGSWPS